VPDAIAVIVGGVIGAGIFRTPSIVAGNVPGEMAMILVWVAGGLVSAIGAMCYAELAAAYPHSGGDYHYITRAFGRNLGFLFAWARMAVIQTGSIATLAFVVGDYANEVLPIDGALAAAIYAGVAVVALTGLHTLGIEKGKWTQNVLTLAKTVGLLLVFLAGVTLARHATPIPAGEVKASGSWGLAMIFVLFTFGGWNEAAYISAEVREPRRNMVRALLAGVGVITLVYVLVNIAYVHGLGLAAMAGSKAVAADLIRRSLGEPGARLVSLLIVISALGATSSTIFTGARTNYALGCDTPAFALIGRWSPRRNTPTAALLLQAAIALALVLLGALTRKGFETMVDYTVPVFWFFFLLAGLSVFVLRVKEPNAPRPFRVPLYPVTPALFCATCLYMLYSSLNHVGIGSLAGVVVLLAGVPVLIFCRRREAQTTDPPPTTPPTRR
jgi:amino acid transporter